MKIASVVCEFNPFHNGHAYLLEKLREEHGADYIIAIMSGNYVQRGEPAFFDKYKRAEMALKGDGAKGHADLVIELPTVFSCASAREFASAGVMTAVSTGITDILGFGVEDGAALGDIRQQAKLLSLLEDNGSGNAEFKRLLRSGMSYPEAAAAYMAVADRTGGGSVNIYASNNILAAEYLAALDKFDAAHRISPAVISRIGDGYASEKAEDSKYCSATALRKYIEKMSAESKKSAACLGDVMDHAALLCADTACMPENSGDYPKTGYTVYSEDSCKNTASNARLRDFIGSYVPAELSGMYEDCICSMTANRLSGILSDRLLEAKYRGLDLTDYVDVSREIADRLLKNADRPLSFEERIAAVKTRQYTYTRISRALLHIALGIRQSELEEAKQSGYIRYLRILGLRRDATGLLKALKKNASVPIISKTADGAEMLRMELYYSGIYNVLSGGRSEYERSPVIV